jgi:hypothetical protein
VRRLLAVLLALLAPLPVHALSCLPPDVVRSYKEVDATPERWGAVVGRLDFDESRLPKPTWDSDPNVPPETRLRAQLVGHSLGPDGWTHPFQGNVTLVVQCWGPWCATPQSGQRVLVFLQRVARGHLAFADPCGTRFFPRPRRADLDRLQDCFRGGPCEEAPLP